MRFGWLLPMVLVMSVMILTTPAKAFRCDIDGSGRIDSMDLVQLSMAFGSVPGHVRWNPRADLDASGVIDGDDLTILGAQFGRVLPDFTAEHVEGELVVLFKPEATLSSMESVVTDAGGRITYRSDSAQMVVVEVPTGMSEQELAGRLFDDPAVKYVEPNYIYHTSWTPNDQYYSFQWHFDLINMPEAWDVERGGDSSVIVAVLDTGIAYEDYGTYCQASDFQGTRFVSPRDYVNGDTHANDDDGHGTHVAGTIAQRTNNNTGVAGIAFNCSVMPVKVCGAGSTGCPLSAIADGIRWAANNGADVINMSLGGPASKIEHDAVIYAYDMGVTIVAAAGNDGVGALDYPAAYAETIAVGAVRLDTGRAYYSNYGTSLDLVAPGGDVRVDQDSDGYVDGVLQQTFDGNYCNFGYYFFQGTSMATPHVAGVCALLASRGVRDPEDMRRILTETATDLGAEGFDAQYGAGLLNAAKAVKNASGDSWGWNN